MSDLPEFVLEREFNAPRDLVWRTWTEQKFLARWYGPGVETVIHSLNVVSGGEWLVEMRWDGGGNFQKAEYLDVRPPEKLVWLQSMTDDNWELASNPQMPDWPRFLKTEITFEEISANATKMVLRWTPYEATPAELACFAGAIDRLGQGWGAGMAIIDEILAELQAA